MPQLTKDTRILKDPVTGNLIEVPAADADARAEREGLDYATLAEIETANEREKYGTAGQQALGALELAGESATLGLYAPEGEAAKKRREVLRRESPVTAFAAESAAILPGVAAGALTGGLGAAAGLGARAAGLAAAVAEGGVSGYAQEQVQAREEGRDIDVGNILLYGVAGELAGRVIPKALGAAARRVAGTGEDALAGSADNVLVRAERRAGQSGSDVAKQAPGPDRDRFLRDNARDVVSDAAERARKSLDEASVAFQDLGDISKKRRKIANLVSREHPAQDRWVNEQVESFGAARQEVEALADVPGLQGVSKKLGAFLDDAEAKLTSSRKAADRFIAADEVKRGLQRFHTSLGRAKMTAQDQVYHEQMMSVVDAVQEAVRRGLEDESLWGRAARFQADVNSAWHNLWFQGAPVVESDLARITGRDFDAKAITEFDPAKLRSFLEKDQVGRGLTAEKLEAVLDGYQEMAEAHRKWGMSPASELDKVQRNVAEVRRSIAEADEVQQAIPRAAKEDAREAAMDQIAMAVPVVGSAYVGVKKLLRNINTAGKSSVRSSANMLVNGVRKVGKALDRSGDFGGPVGAVAAGHLSQRQTTEERFKGDFPSMTQSFMAKRQQIATALQEPDSLVDALANSMGDLATEFPDVHLRLVERMTAAFHYMAQHLPPGVESSIVEQHAPPPDIRSIRQFAQLWEAVMNPGAVVADFATMQATPAQARAIEAVHPDLWAQLQTEVLTAFAESTVRPSWERKRYAAQIFRLGPSLGGVWKPSVARNIANSMAVEPKSNGAPSSQLESFLQAMGPSKGIAAITNGPTSGRA